MVAFLASAEAGYIQGAILDIDGGWNRATENSLLRGRARPRWSRSVVPE